MTRQPAARRGRPVGDTCVRLPSTRGGRGCALHAGSKRDLEPRRTAHRGRPRPAPGPAAHCAGQGPPASPPTGWGPWGAGIQAHSATLGLGQPGFNRFCRKVIRSSPGARTLPAHRRRRRGDARAWQAGATRATPAPPTPVARFLRRVPGAAEAEGWLRGPSAGARAFARTLRGALPL